MDGAGTDRSDRTRAKLIVAGLLAFTMLLGTLLLLGPAILAVPLETRVAVAVGSVVAIVVTLALMFLAAPFLRLMDAVLWSVAGIVGLAGVIQVLYVPVSTVVVLQLAAISATVAVIARLVVPKRLPSPAPWVWVLISVAASTGAVAAFAMLVRSYGKGWVFGATLLGAMVAGRLVRYTAGVPVARECLLGGAIAGAVTGIGASPQAAIAGAALLALPCGLGALAEQRRADLRAAKPEMPTARAQPSSRSETGPLPNDSERD
jgi:hypothetical protein